jgi:nitrite reductase/ring-hydroxylating ferredoxin subunit
MEVPSDLSEGETRAMKVNEDDEILVAKYKGEIRAVGNRCTYKGSRLSQGPMFDDKIVCCDHACAYSIVTGRAEQGPGRDNIPTFSVTEREGKHFVEIPAGDLTKGNSSPMAVRDP